MSEQSMEMERETKPVDRLAGPVQAGEEIDVLNNLAWEQREVNPIQAEELANHALVLSRTPDRFGNFYIAGFSRALITMGELAMRTDAYGLALTHLLEAYTLLQGQYLPALIADACHAIGWAHIRLGNFDEAISFLDEALEIHQKLKNPTKEAGIHSSRASAYSLQGFHAQAVATFQHALDLLGNSAATRARGAALNNLANTQVLLGENDKALENILAAIQIFRELNLTALEASGLDTLGQVYTARGELSKAEEALLECLEIARHIKSEHMELVALLSLGKVYHQQGRATLASELFTQSLQLADQYHSNSFLSQYHEMLAILCEEQGDLKTSLVHYRQFHAAMDLALAEAAGHRLDNLKILHQVEKKRKEAEVLRLQNRALERLIEIHRRERAELEKLATIDVLTGLYNHGHLFTLGEYELEKARQQKSTFSIILLDIDHFKLVNDQYNHAAGDRVLVEIANLIVENARKGDICCRYGGEEFVILLPDSTLAHGQEAAERIRQAVFARVFRTGNAEIRVTSSLGVAQSDLEDSELSDVLSRADHALYRAKSAGRNRVSI